MSAVDAANENTAARIHHETQKAVHRPAKSILVVPAQQVIALELELLKIDKLGQRDSTGWLAGVMRRVRP